ncbi:hypothetical protein D1007_37371 [Hordeum vulgare]|nr:hypothetical protein D1007_37371 [Hordeum vulgare]
MSEAVGTSESGGGGGVKEQERFLPIANIGRNMQRAMSEKGKIAKDARESIQECVSEFISFITSEPHVWSHFCLCFKDEKMTDDKAMLRAFGIKDGDEVCALSSSVIGRQPLILLVRS